MPKLESVVVTNAIIAFAILLVNIINIMNIKVQQLVRNKNYTIINIILITTLNYKSITFIEYYL